MCEFAGDTDLGYRDIYKHNFFLVRNCSFLHEVMQFCTFSVSFLPEYLQMICENLPD